MLGSVQAARTDGVLARLIGVLPKKEQIVFKTEQDHQLLIPTVLSSGQRNPINSLTSDAVLVLNGGSGTLAELGFALVANKICHLVGSAQKLRGTLQSDPTEVQSLIKQGLSKYPAINGQSFTAEHILEGLTKHLIDGPDDLPLPDDADRARARVDAILSTIDPDLLSHSSGFPGVPGVLSKANFEDWLSRMP